MAKKRQTTDTIVWKNGSPFSKYEVGPIHKEVERLRMESGGELNPASIVEAAKNKRSSLHPIIFREDDETAAHQRRLDIAGRLIRSIHIIRVDHPELGSMRQYEVKPGAYAKGGERRSFNTLENLLSNDEDRSEVLKRAMLELLAWQRKFRAIQEFAVIVREIDALVENIKL